MNEEIATALREGLTDDAMRQMAVEADIRARSLNGIMWSGREWHDSAREFIISALTPVVERLLADVTKELRDRDKTISRQLERRASGMDPVTVGERERADANEARASEAERRLREIGKLIVNDRGLVRNSVTLDRVLALLDTGAGQAR